MYENESGTNDYIPIYALYADAPQHSQMIYPAEVLATIGEGATISKLVFYTNAWTSSSGYTIDDIGTWTVRLGETTASTLANFDETTTLTEVFSDVLVSNDAHTTITIDFTTNYTYNGGNLLIDITHEAVSPYISIRFLGKSDAISASFYQYESSWGTSGGVQNFLPRVTITHEGGTVNPCQAPTLAEAVLTQGNGRVATLNWTENGESDSWVLQVATNNTFTEGLSTYEVSGTPTKNLQSLTAEQTYYARVKPSCDTEGNKWSNTVSFTPTAAITATIYQNATDHCDYVPVYGYYADNKQQSEFIIPASQLSDLADGTIKAMTFYAGYNFNSTASFQVYLKEVEDETISQSTFYGTEGATTVYTGKVSISSTNGMTITFTNNYAYNGGNLLVGFYLPSGGNCSSSGDYFIGKTVNGASHSSTFGNDPTQRNFIPTTTFLYLPSPTPKPLNLHVVDGSLWSGGATLAWEAPSSATPTSYQYRYNNGINWTGWESTADLSVDLTLTASTHYTFQVRANYAEGNSNPVETDFTTLDDCAFPTNLVATTTPGQGTKATLTWVKGYDEDAWVLEYATNNTFTEGHVTMTDGFTAEGNNVTANLTGLTAETHYYARVKANCGGGSTSEWSNVVDFTPTNYVDYTFGQAAVYTSYSVPIYGSYVGNSPLLSQFIIPSSELVDMAGGTIRRMTFHSGTASASWGNAEFSVYVKEVEASSFASPSASGLEDWSSMTNVYNGSLSISGNQMVIEFANDFAYNGGNLMIGFNETTTGTGADASWYYVSGPSNSTLYAYYYYGASYSCGSSLPKVTFNYRPTATPRPIITEPVQTTDVTATIAWTKPSANVTGYKYQYKLASATEWPTAWTSLGADAVSVTVPGLTPNTEYNFRIKAVYAEGESFTSTTSFATSCPATTAVPYTYDFETAPKFNCWEVISGTITRINAIPHLGDYRLDFRGTNSNMIVLPTFAEATNTLRIEFWTRPESSSAPSNLSDYSGKFAVGYMTNIADASTFVAIETYNATDWAESLTYTKKVVDFDVTGVPADAHIAMRQFDCATNYYWYVDDVKVKVIPTCEDVNDVHYVSFTNHSATIAWTADAAQAAWQIAYKAGANFDPYNAEELDAATIVDVTANPYLFDKNLEAETTYYMYVRGNCGNSDLGDWSDSYATFTTSAASPAPSNFIASNIGSQTADLVWTAGGGDYELSWDLYYEQTDDAPTAPTEETPATKTVTTLPTTENPYTLDGLTEESRYYIWVRANHTINSVTTHSAWVALTGNYFTTLAACPTPTELTASNLTAVSADLSWVGSPDVTDYTVQYRTSATPTTNSLFFEGFETYADEAALEAVWTVIDLGDGANTAELGLYEGAAKTDDYGFRFSSYSKESTTQSPYTSEDFDQYLISPELTVNGVLAFVYKSTYGTTDVFRVGYSSTTNDLSAFTWGDQINSASSWKDFSETMPAGTKYFAINYMGLYQYRLYIDDINIYETLPAGEWITAADDVTLQSYQLNNLTGGIKYDAHVKSNCTSGEYCPEISFTTLADGTKVFVTPGEWGTATNWMPNGAPAITDEVIIRANAIIPSGTVATAKKITMEGATTPTLTINDGGQLQTDNTVTATVKKTITGYTSYTGQGNGGYYLIGNPLNGTVYSSSFATVGLISGNFDLYSWSYSSSDDKEWRNYETSSFSLSTQTGYLYANENDVTLTFTGTVMANNTDVNKSLSYSTYGNYAFNGWNLVANPFVCNAYIKDATDNIAAFYRMNADGDGYTAATGAIAPMEGIFVKATASSQSFEFTRTAPDASTGNGQLNINLAQAVTNRGEKGSTDNAIIRFGEGNTLEKFSFRANSTKVYIPQDGKDYAVVNAGKVGEIPVSFKAEKNGSYNLSFTSQEVSFSYLHLIDNLTGNDVNLLANPSYSFNAQTTDYASRFRLVFATGSSVDGDNFAFINTMGNLSIFGIEGTATVQVIDLLGHVLSSDTFSGSYEKKLNVAPGVYMIRLINGDDVKVQKIVVR